MVKSSIFFKMRGKSLETLVIVCEFFNLIHLIHTIL